MLKNLGSAFKKMASRSMMRGDRGAAEAINNFGIEGMRSNMKNSNQNTNTNTNPTNQNPIKKDFSADLNISKKLGSSILDSVK